MSGCYKLESNELLTFAIADYKIIIIIIVIVCSNYQYPLATNEQLCLQLRYMQSKMALSPFVFIPSKTMTVKLTCQPIPMIALYPRTDCL